MDFNIDINFVAGMVIQNERLIPGEVTVELFTDEELLDINKEFLSHDYYTDIITFDERIGNVVNGELLISKDRVRENAVSNNVSFSDEMLRIYIHGVLHLCGYGDKSEEEAELMRDKEDFYIAKYNVSRETL
jgi:rRNA maturation RNase YbeY